MPTPSTPRGRPLLRYYGSKWMLAPWIISHFPEHRTYVEPYGGGANVLLRKARAHTEVYNDLDSEIVNVFRMTRERGDELQRQLHLTPYAVDEFEGAYEPSDDPLEAARRTIVRSFFGYGSNAATGGATGFRTTNGKSAASAAGVWRNYAESFPRLIERLRGVMIQNTDAAAVIAQHDSPDTLHYADPPYVADTRCGAQVYRHEMADQEHRKLAALLTTVQGMVVLSGYRCALYDELYSTWRCVPRSASAGSARSPREVLWLNEAADSALPIPGENP